MAMTLVEKILARHADLDEVRPGQLVEARVDKVLANDITAPIAIKEFRRLGAPQVFDRDRVILVPDHFAPNKDIASAEQCKLVREFSVEQQLTNYFEVGRMGIEHALLPEQGLVLPGEIIIGADSHTCTHGALGALATGVGSTDVAAAMITGKAWFKVPEKIKFVIDGQLPPWVSGKDLILYIIGDISVDGALYRAMEFGGSTIDALSMDGRLTIANMAIEAGGKCGLFNPDRQTLEFVRERSAQPFEALTSDPDAEYREVRTYDAAQIQPQVAFPHSPDNTRPISEVGTVAVQQAVIGSCTNGRMEDLRIAAQVLRGRSVDRGVRLIVIPGTQQIYKQAMREGLMEVFIDAGAAVSTPTCGPCLGGHMGILAKGESAIATTNRNFVGRMGHPESFVYLSNPAVAAASAVLGRIASPDEL